MADTSKSTIVKCKDNFLYLFVISISDINE